MAQLLGFDPLKFLDITNLHGQEKDIISKNLLDKFSQYLLIRVAELLPSDWAFENLKSLVKTL